MGCGLGKQNELVTPLLSALMGLLIPPSFTGCCFDGWHQWNWIRNCNCSGLSGWPPLSPSPLPLAPIISRSWCLGFEQLGRCHPEWNVSVSVQGVRVDHNSGDFGMMRFVTTANHVRGVGAGGQALPPGIPRRFGRRCRRQHHRRHRKPRHSCHCPV